MAEAILKRHNQGFFPLSESDSDLLQHIKTGDEVKAVLTKPRNYKYHKKFFVFLQHIFNNQDQFNNFEEMRAFITVRSGYYNMVYRSEDQIILMPKSISFASMDETEFRELFNKAIDVVISTLITGATAEEIEKNVERLIVEFS